MRGGYKYQPGWRVSALRWLHAGKIDVDSLEFYTVHLQNVTNAPVGWLFNPCAIAGVTQHARHQIDGLVNTLSYQDLPGATAHGAGNAKIFHQRLLQCLATACIAVGELAGLRFAADTCLDFTKQGMWKGADIGHAG